MFHNGDVQKMWKWWEATDPVRVADAAAPGAIGELLSEEEEDRESLQGRVTNVNRDFPRTLRDFTDMTRATKEAQWGDQVDSDVLPRGMDGPGPAFFEDASDASTDSGDDDMDEPPEKDLYDSYVGDTPRPLLESSPANRGASSDLIQHVGKRSDDPFGGPSADMLSPFVSLSYAFERISLNGQSAALALAMKLGMIGGHSLNDAELQGCYQSSQNALSRHSDSTAKRTGGK